MQINVSTNFDITLNRLKGGALVRAQLEAWKSDASDWKLAGAFPMVDVLNPSETVACTLPPGTTYLCILRYDVIESLNGVFEYDFSINGTRLIGDSGNVNKTSNPNDTSSFKAQFMLHVS